MDSRGITASLREKIAEIGRLLEWMEQTGQAHPIDFELILSKTRELYELEVFFSSGMTRPHPAANEPVQEDHPIIPESVEPPVKQEMTPPVITTPSPTIDFLFSEPEPPRIVSADPAPAETRLNETLGKQKQVPDVASALTEIPVDDIWSAMAINDRFLFMRELFANDSEAFKTTVSLLNSLPSWDAASRYMADHFHWETSLPVVKEFQSIVRRRFLK